MLKIPTVKPKVAFSFLYGFFVLVVILFMFFWFKRTEFKEERQNLYKEKATITFDFLNSQYSIAENLASVFAEDIERNLLFEFRGNHDDLINQLNDLKFGIVKTNKVTDIIMKTVKGRTFRDIGKILPNSSDRNDFVVFLCDIIIVDLSADCAPKNGLRDIMFESKNQFNPTLARDAMRKLIEAKSTRAFWHFSPFYKDTDKYYENVLSIPRSDLVLLKEMFLNTNCDIKFLEKFEFLAVAHISDKDHDVFSRDIKMPNGNYVSGSLQLHIFQGFNLLDAIAIDKDFSAKLADIDSSISKLDTQFTIFQVFCLFFCFVMAAVFVFLIIIVDISEHKYELDHAKS